MPCAAVLVDRLSRNRRVGEDPLPRVLDRGGATDGRGHRVGQREQVPQTAPGGRRPGADRGGQQQMYVVPCGVLVHGQQGHTRRLRLRERAVRVRDDQPADRLRRRPRQRPRRGRPHPDREQQRPGRTGQRRVGVVQQRLGDGHGEPGGRGLQSYGGAADDVQQVAEGTGVHAAPSQGMGMVMGMTRMVCRSGRAWLADLIRNVRTCCPDVQRGRRHELRHSVP